MAEFTFKWRSGAWCRVEAPTLDIALEDANVKALAAQYGNSFAYQCSEVEPDEITMEERDSEYEFLKAMDDEDDRHQAEIEADEEDERQEWLRQLEIEDEACERACQRELDREQTQLEAWGDE